ncbi:hypothetical protein SAMN05444166_6416 [Singulisphaera sp. GP187]|uniref:hypothetical protein n=1 Tax=Singulisphaera sp. GP187 TaxID=1882752 RepID=UPI00092ADC01|nr:hypothetical protein [Singulisphaera sp. GP187]SIO60501.1 hypothetical protein SAMN05444166_6416 [Singulisphaera sp. GP187]
MQPPRFTIARLLVLIVFFGIVFAGLRSGSNDWFKLIYSLTFLTLVYAAIAARYRRAFWHGFAVAGWAYFVIGFGPWIGSPSGSQPPGVVNRNLVSSVVLEIVSGIMHRSDAAVAAGSGPFPFGIVDLLEANRNGVGHCALTILFAFVGGLISRNLAGRPRTED